MRSWVWGLLLGAGLTLSALAQHWLDAQRRPELRAEDALYLTSGEMLKRASLGFDGLLADVYWLRTVLYLGAKLAEQRAAGPDFDVREVRLLKPLLEIITELDPHHVAAYRLGGFFLQRADAAEALNFIERGIRNNPGEWRLYQDWGFALWQQGRFREAADAYARGSRASGAPAWLQPLAATLLIKGGDYATARELLLRLYVTSDDEFVKAVCLEQLRRLETQQRAPHPQSPIRNPQS